MKKALLLGSSVATIIFLWFLIYIIIGQPLIVPSIGSVFVALGRIVFSHDIITILFSLLRLFTGFIASALLGVALGFIAAKKQGFKIWLQPYVTLLRTIPVLAIVVILFIILGSNASVYVIVFLMIFPLFYQATLDGIQNINPELMDVLKLEQAHLKESIRYVYLPLIKDDLMVVIFQSLGLGVKVLVMAEYIMQVNNSIGMSLYIAKINLNYDQVYAWTILLVILTSVFELLVHIYKKKTQ